MAQAFVALGSNLGNRESLLRSAVAALHEAAGIKVLAASRVYETPAQTRPPHASQPPYLNAVVQVATPHAPDALVKRLLALENLHGRTRNGDWAPRTLDLDLLLWEHRTLATARVALPHPRLHLRRFVLQPLADLAAGVRVPAPHHATVLELLARCPDPDVPVLTDIDLSVLLRP